MDNQAMMDLRAIQDQKVMLVELVYPALMEFPEEMDVMVFLA